MNGVVTPKPNARLLWTRIFWPAIESDDFLSVARRRVLTLVCGTIAVLGPITGVLSFSVRVENSVFFAFAGILAPFAFLVLPVLSHVTGRTRLLSLIMVASLYALCLAMTVGSGQSMSAIYLVAVPFLTAMLCGCRLGFLTGAVVVATYAVLTPAFLPPWVGIFSSLLVIGVTLSSCVFQREMECATEVLVAEHERAKQANDAKTNFLANINHEFRTPLNGILGVVSILERTDLDPRQAELVALVRSSGEAMRGLVEDVLDFSDIQAGTLTLHRDPFSVGDLLAQASVIMTDALADREVTFSMACECGSSCQVMGDLPRLKQILINLLGNAVKFTDRGSIRLTVQRSGGDLMRFEVTDTGPGIDPSEEGVIFRHFSRGSESSARRLGGAGLGLTIAKGLVESMGGQIGVARGPGGVGASFWFTVPLAEAADDGLSEAHRAGGSQAPDGEARLVALSS